MGHSLREKSKEKEVQSRYTMQWNHPFPVDLEYLSQLLTLINWSSSQKQKNHIQSNQTSKRVN